MATSHRLLGLLTFCVALQAVTALSGEVVVYWGQGPNSEQALRQYCMDSTYDILVLSFLHDWPFSDGDSKYPAIDMGYCSSKAVSGTKNLLNCPNVGSDITYCQSRGKKVFLSMGGSGGDYGFNSVTEATNFATLVWNTFMGGTSAVPRPFGNAIIDGIDLDVEHGNSIGYAEFTNKLRSYYTSQSARNYYISSAPQCPYPDDWMGPGQGLALTSGWFDYVWVQFYNNNCGLDRYPSKFNFNTWANWAKTTSVNKNVKVLIGAPSSSDSAGTGYVNAATLKTISEAMYQQYPTIFGGVMMWEAGRAATNNNFGAQVAAFLHTGSSPATQAPTTPAPTPAPTKAPTPAPTKAPTPVTPAPTRAPTPATPAPTKAPTPVTKPPVSGNDNNGGGSAPISPPSGSCTTGNMKCASSSSYQTCTHGAWAQAQSCQSGLTCTPVGVYIYCM